MFLRLTLARSRERNGCRSRFCPAIIDIVICVMGNDVFGIKRISIALVIILIPASSLDVYRIGDCGMEKERAYFDVLF